MPTRPLLLVPEDSPLRNPPVGLDPQQKVGLDGVRFALDMAHLSFVRLHDELEELSKESKTGQNRTAAACALSDAWSLVDNLWRLNLVIRQVRRLKISPELEVQLRALAEVEDLRNGMQHIYGEIRKSVESGVPLWGSLSWCWTPNESPNDPRVFLMMPGAFRGPATHPIPNPIGKTVHAPIGMITLAAFGHVLPLSHYIDRITAIANGLDRGVREAIAKLPSEAIEPGGADFLVSVHIRTGPKA